MIVTRPQPLYRLSPVKRPVPSEVRQCGVCRPHILSMPIRHPAYLLISYVAIFLYSIKLRGKRALVLDLDKKTVSIDGEAVPFTKTEFELLHLLLEDKGRVFSRQELIDRVWPKDVMVLDRTVDVNITRMRKKVGRFAKCIVTRLGFGYYFDA